MLKISTFFTLPLLLLLPFACTSDQLESNVDPDLCDGIEATYDTNIKLIIDVNCAFAGCHVGGFPNGDFSTYQGMLGRLESGSIKAEVIDAKTMPVGFSLTDEDFLAIQCWLQNDYPEN